MAQILKMSSEMPLLALMKQILVSIDSSTLFSNERNRFYAYVCK